MALCVLPSRRLVRRRNDCAREGRGPAAIDARCRTAPRSVGLRPLHHKRYYHYLKKKKKKKEKKERKEIN